MRRILCPTLPKPGRPVALEETEAHHATRVLRLREGDRVEAMDGKGNSVSAILRVRGGPVRLEVPRDKSEQTPTTLKSRPDRVMPVTLEMAILKGEAMEWTIEKAVELGVQAILPTVTAHTVVQIDRKGPKAFQERWQRIADQALKQCGRLERMEILEPCSLEEALQQNQGSADFPRVWLDEAFKDSRQADTYLFNWLTKNRGQLTGVRLLIGPEGGWSDLERDLLTQSATSAPNTTQRLNLGPLVLRAETAAIFASGLATAIFHSEALLDNNTPKKDSEDRDGED